MSDYYKVLSDICSIKLYHNVPQYATNGYNTVNQLKIFAIFVKFL